MTPDLIACLKAVALGAPEAEWDRLAEIACRWLIEHAADSLTESEREAIEVWLADRGKP